MRRCCDKNIVSEESVYLETRGHTLRYLYLQNQNEQGKEKGKRPPADIRQKAFEVEGGYKRALRADVDIGIAT